MAAVVLWPLPQACRAALLYALLIGYCTVTLQTIHPPAATLRYQQRLSADDLKAARDRATDLAMLMLRPAAYGAVVTQLALRQLACRARRATAAAGVVLAAGSLYWAAALMGAVAAAGGGRAGSIASCYYLGLVAVRACGGFVHALLGVFWGADQ